MNLKQLMDLLQSVQITDDAEVLISFQTLDDHENLVDEDRPISEIRISTDGSKIKLYGR